MTSATTLAVLLAAAVTAPPQESQVELLKTFRQEFLLVTPGQGPFPATYQRGRGQGGDDSERPVERVQLNYPFHIARYEVPQNLWEAVMGTNPSRWKGPRNSVEMLSFDEAVAFCEKATRLMREAGLIAADQQVRLPSESEWEYAARAGTDTLYSFGDDDAKLGDYGWFTGNAAGNDPPVGAKKPNAWGLYDVHGYLWEWCSDHGHATYQGAPRDGSAWTKDGDPRTRIVRGGSWKDKAEKLTSSFRLALPKETRDDAVGLRCVLTVSEGEQATAAAPFRPTAQDEFVPAGSRLEVVWNEGEFTEGPARAPDDSILFTDIGNTIFRYDPQAGEVSVYRRPSGKANGLMFDARGRLLACEGAAGGNRRVSITTADGDVKSLADQWQGKRFNSPNDLAIHPGGDVYFTDPRYGGDEPRELDFEGVFVIRGDQVRLASRDVQRPNGILVSADGQTVYVADNNNRPGGNRHLLAFRVQPDGTLTDKRILFDFGAERRGIDGMTLDVHGNLYATAGRGDEAGIYVFSPDGGQLAFLPTPGDPTNCVFGGAGDERTLYITAEGPPVEAGQKRRYALYRITMAKQGYHLPSE